MTESLKYLEMRGKNESHKEKNMETEIRIISSEPLLSHLGSRDFRQLTPCFSFLMWKMGIKS